MQKKWLITGIIILLFIAFLAWLFIESTKPPPPLPGTKVDDLGRSHITNIQGVTYNSNPPTSGPHFPVWAKRGVYDRVLSDGYLIHSLEHGYIVLSYNCTVKPEAYIFIKQASAHEGELIETHPHPVSTNSAQLMEMKVEVSEKMSAFTPQNPPEVETPLSEEFSSDSCKDLVNKLSSFLDNYQRIIVVPRPGLDTKIALTAWTRLDGMDQFDSDRIKAFIDAFHNKGPERTVE